MENKFIKLRLELNDLGYSETLKPDCVPLVDRLFSDLKTTTESLEKYMKLAQQAIEERDNLRLGAEPYKCDNAKLIRECNELHLAFIQFKEQHENIQRELKSKISSLRSQLESCDLEKQEYQKKIKDLELQLDKGQKKGTKVTSTTSLPPTSKIESSRKSFQLHTAMANADQKIAFLNKQIKKLKDEQLNLVENNETLKGQLRTRDEEITRLKNLLEGGRPLEAINKDCCYRNIDNKIGALKDEICTLKSEKNSLQNQLKDALAKQHEAMRRALHLVERNKELEKEMKDIDQIALAVEAECNNTVRSNVEKVTRLQDRINESVIMIQNLERENSRLRQDKEELSADLDAIKLEKKHLQCLLDTEIEDKKRLTDRINSFARIENDLNLEIDRLVRLTGEHKKKIAELECQVTEEKLKSSSLDLQRPLQERVGRLSQEINEKNQTIAELQQKIANSTEDHYSSNYKTMGTVKSAATRTKATITDRASKTKPPAKEHKTTCKKFPGKRRPSITKSQPEEKSAPLVGSNEAQTGKCCCEADSCIKHMKELLDKEMEYRQAQAMQQIESLKQEKEYYMKEYHRVCDQIRNVPTHDKPDKLQEQCEQLRREIDAKDKIIAELQSETESLGREKYVLRTRLDSLKEHSETEVGAICDKPQCKRHRRELDIVKTELKHLESENDSLKKRILALNDSIGMDQDRMQKVFQEMEDHIQKLEDERRELVTGQITSRSNVTQLEEDYKLVKEQLRTTQTELINQKANYGQLKALHDQCDRIITEARNKTLRLEAEMVSLHAKMADRHRESEVHSNEVARLQSDIEYMKAHMAKMDKEKADLLNLLEEKTEKVASLDDQLREKKNAISSLEMELKELKRKLGNFSDDASLQQQSIRSLKQDVALLEKDYEAEKKSKEAAVQENRRLQSDLTSALYDCKEARKQLDISQRQVEDLKRQLQHYVAEVKRTEDLISQKELERTEILDQFKCLSEEANVLESSNHTLENEATQSRVQLSVALDHASDLERRLENQDSVIRSYEKQITDLTSQVASLEIQLKQSNSQYDRMMMELTQTKDLCIKLDHERESLRRELREGSDQRGHAERNIEFHARQNEELKKLLDKERINLEGVEKLLKEARQDVIEQKLLNQDLQAELTRLKTKINDLQERLATTTEQLDLYQEKALDYSQQNKQLRREIANERFFRAKEDENKRSQPKTQRFPAPKDPPNPRKIITKPFDTGKKIAESKIKKGEAQRASLPATKSLCHESCNKSICTGRKFPNKEKPVAQIKEGRGLESANHKPTYSPVDNKFGRYCEGQVCVCTCIQCLSGKVSLRGKDSEARSRTDRMDETVTLMKYRWSQTKCDKSKKVKSHSASSPEEVVSVSSQSSLNDWKCDVHCRCCRNRITFQVP